MLIDIHVHTNRYSPCGRSSPEAMVERAIEIGLEGLVFTEHNILWPAEELDALQARYPVIRLLRGIEVVSSEGDDYLVYGITQEGLFTAHMDAVELIRRVRAHDGVVVLAHPYRYRPEVPAILERHPVDGIEVYSNNILNYAHPHARALCAKLGCFATAASDAHVVDTLGLYALRFDDAVRDERELAQALRRCAFALHIDDARVAAKNAEIQANLDLVRDLMAQGYEDIAIRDRVPGMGLTMLRAIRQGVDMLHPGNGKDRP